MNHFPREASNFPIRHSLNGAVALAASGSDLLYVNSNSDSTKISISLQIPASLDESLALPWKMLQYYISLRPFMSNDHWQLGNLPLFSARVSPAASADIKRESSGVTGDCPKPCCGCLERDTIANAAAKVAPAIVNLSVPQGFYGITTGKSIGSGTIIDPDGTILTCAHVVVDFQGVRVLSIGKVDVTLQDGRTFEGAVLNADLHSDIAIVKISSKTPLPSAKLGFSSRLRPGNWVIAMGCPLSLQNTVTAGIVREILVGLLGEVVGVNNMKVLAAHGLSFAVPIDSVTKIIEHFKKSGRVVRPWLGLKMIDLNEMITAQLKERDPRFPNVNRGVLVPMVTPGSPADRAGFHPGDVVIEFDKKPVESIEIIEIMGDRVGVPIEVVVKRANDALMRLN